MTLLPGRFLLASSCQLDLINAQPDWSAMASAPLSCALDQPQPQSPWAVHVKQEEASDHKKPLSVARVTRESTRQWWADTVRVEPKAEPVFGGMGRGNTGAGIGNVPVLPAGGAGHVVLGGAQAAPPVATEVQNRGVRGEGSRVACIAVVALIAVHLLNSTGRLRYLVWCPAKWWCCKCGF
jgi:hypothetical protein